MYETGKYSDLGRGKGVKFPKERRPLGDNAKIETGEGGLSGGGCGCGSGDGEGGGVGDNAKIETGERDGGGGGSERGVEAAVSGGGEQ